MKLTAEVENALFYVERISPQHARTLYAAFERCNDANLRAAMLDDLREASRQLQDYSKRMPSNWTRKRAAVNELAERLNAYVAEFVKFEK